MNRQEEKVEVERERRDAMDDHADGSVNALRTSAKKCAVSSSSCGTKMRVQSQCMYATRPLKCRCNVSTSSLVSNLVSCLLYALFQFCL